MNIRPERELLQMAQCVYSIPCECGGSYIDETDRSLAMRHHEYKWNLKEGLLEKSELAQYTYEEGHRVGWDEVRILEIGSNSRYRNQPV
jgi:hypothetical protein